MKIEDKRDGRRDEEMLGSLQYGLVVEFFEGCGQFTTSLSPAYRTGLILDRDSILPEGEKSRFKNKVPVAFFSGEFAWMPTDLVVKCVDAKVVVDYFDPDEDIPHIKVVRGAVG